MAWTIRFDARAEKRFGKLSQDVQRRIWRYLMQRIAVADDPRQFGKPLVGDKSGLWRYRVDDYRVLCQVKDHEMIVLVVEVGHRKEIYD